MPIILVTPVTPITMVSPITLVTQATLFTLINLINLITLMTLVSLVTLTTLVRLPWSLCWSLSSLLLSWSKYFPWSGHLINFIGPSGSPFRRFFYRCDFVCLIKSPSWASNNSRPGRGCKSRLEQLGGASSRASCPWGIIIDDHDCDYDVINYQ